MLFVFLPVVVKQRSFTLCLGLIGQSCSNKYQRWYSSFISELQMGQMTPNVEGLLWSEEISEETHYVQCCQQVQVFYWLCLSHCHAVSKQRLQWERASSILEAYWACWKITALLRSHVGVQINELVSEQLRSFLTGCQLELWPWWCFLHSQVVRQESFFFFFLIILFRSVFLPLVQPYWIRTLQKISPLMCLNWCQKPLRHLVEGWRL